MTHDGLLIDFGGVMTTNVFESFAAFCRAEGLDPDTVKDRFRNDQAARDLLGALEEGKLSNADFEAQFAEMLGVADHEGLIARYEERSGRSMGDVRWYMTLALWKSAVFLEGSYKRRLAGTTEDAFFDLLKQGVPDIADRAWRIAQGS